MLNPIHTRNSPFSKSSFASMEDVDEYVDHVMEIVEDAIGRAPEVSISLAYPDRSFPTMSQEEFQGAKGELPFQEVIALDVKISDKEDSDFGVGLHLSGASGRVTVQGRSVTRVDGVDVQIRKELDRLQDTRDREVRQRQGERGEAIGRVAASVVPVLPLGPVAAEAVRFLRLRNRRPRRNPAPLPSSAGRWRRVANSPWTITIVGGAIAAAIAVGLVALVILLATSAFDGGSASGHRPGGESTRRIQDVP